MSTPLTSEESRRYTIIIDDYLATADLKTVTRKKVRKGLERALDNKDLSEQKDAIKALIEARFDALTDNAEDVEEEDDNASLTPMRRGRSDDNDMDTDRSAKKPRHKRSGSGDEDADARLAAELQAQENRLAPGRATRGGSTKPKAKAKPKKKSSAKVDSDSDATPGTETKRKAGGGFQKPLNLSPALAEVVGSPQMSRPQIVSKLWQYIKANNLQDPNDKRQILCDDKLQAVFKTASIGMFQMNKQLSSNLYPVEE